MEQDITEIIYTPVYCLGPAYGGGSGAVPLAVRDPGGAEPGPTYGRLQLRLHQLLPPAQNPGEPARQQVAIKW